MAIKLIDKRADNTSSYIADSDSDVSSLPTDMTKISAGSTCTIIGDGSGCKVLMLNTQGQWKEI